MKDEHLINYKPHTFTTLLWQKKNLRLTAIMPKNERNVKNFPALNIISYHNKYVYEHPNKYHTNTLLLYT